jgi:hypothetical protein
VNECGILVHEVEQNGSENGQAERRVAGGIGDIVSDEDEGTLMDWEELCEDYAKLKGKDICASEAPIREEVEENRDLLAFEADNPKMAGETTSLLGFLNDLPEPVLLHAVNTMSQGTLNQQTSNQNWDPKLGTSIGKCLLSYQLIEIISIVLFLSYNLSHVCTSVFMVLHTLRYRHCVSKILSLLLNIADSAAQVMISVTGLLMCSCQRRESWPQ